MCCTFLFQLIRKWPSWRTLSWRISSKKKGGTFFCSGDIPHIMHLCSNLTRISPLQISQIQLAVHIPFGVFPVWTSAGLAEIFHRAQCLPCCFDSVEVSSHKKVSIWLLRTQLILWNNVWWAKIFIVQVFHSSFYSRSTLGGFVQEFGA